MAVSSHEFQEAGQISLMGLGNSWGIKLNMARYSNLRNGVEAHVQIATLAGSIICFHSV